jgi:hypothetical protein
MARVVKFASYSFLVFQDCNEKVEAQPNDTGVQVGKRPPVIIPGQGDNREEGTTLTREDAAMVETVWGAASFNSPTPVVGACVQKVSVNPCNVKKRYILCIAGCQGRDRDTDPG